MSESNPAYITTPVTSKKIISATVIGNALEFYDFLTYAYFAVYIGKTFFPAQNSFLSLLASVAVFGVGFLTRPLGGILIGLIADKSGRKTAMLITILFITIGTLGLACTPSYTSIGIIAPIIVVTCRLLQGLGLGGEVGPSTAFLVEIAPDNKRGLLASWQLASQGLGSLVSGIFGLILTISLTSDQMLSWGWRVPFIGALLLIPLAFYLRSSMPETLHATSQNPSSEIINISQKNVGKNREFWKLVFISIWVIAGTTVGNYVAIYMNTYAINTLKLSPAIAMSATICYGFSTLVCALFGGWLSDKYGRKPVIIWPRILLLLISYPLFKYLVNHPGVEFLLIACFIVSGLTAMSGAAALVAIPELFQKNVRATGISIAYATSVTIFGGTTQAIIAWLIEATGNAASPAWYMLFITSLSLIAMAAISETRFKNLD